MMSGTYAHKIEANFQCCVVYILPLSRAFEHSYRLTSVFTSSKRFVVRAN